MPVKIKEENPVLFSPDLSVQKGFFECRRWESNPHERKAHYALNVARLPVPPLRLAELFYPET
jgi:hypothetical protein